MNRPHSRWLRQAFGFSAPSGLWLLGVLTLSGGSGRLLEDVGFAFGDRGWVVQALVVALVFVAPQVGAWAAFRAGRRGAPAGLAFGLLVAIETLVLLQILLFVL